MSERLTKSNRLLSSYAVNRALDREALRIAQERSIGIEEAFKAVLEDPILSARCHAEGRRNTVPMPPPGDWTPPEAG